MLWLPFPYKINALFCVSLLANMKGVKPKPASPLSFFTRRCSQSIGSLEYR